MAEGKQACKEAAEQLAMCIEKTPCVQEAGGTIMECLKAKDVGDCEVRGEDICCGVCDRGCPSGHPPAQSRLRPSTDATEG